MNTPPTMNAAYNPYPYKSAVPYPAAQTGNQARPSSPSADKMNVSYLLAPGLELITAITFLLNIPFIKKKIEALLNRFPQNNSAKFLQKALPKVTNPRTSNMLLVATVLLRSIFNSSIGIKQQQAGMITTNIAALLFNVPLMILMERATRKHGAEGANKYSKILALINLMLTGLFTTGFVQKARRDNGKTYYTHDMRNFEEVLDFKNSLTSAQRIKRGNHELKWLVADSGRAYGKAWEEMWHSFSDKRSLKAFLNPVNPDGTAGRVAFSAFTMPLGALLALVNIKSNPRLSAAAAAISILGNTENGLALALSAWQDKNQPFRWLGVIGGLASPLTEGVLTSKSSLGPASMTSSNAFQNLYQATAWTRNSPAQGQSGPEQNVAFNKNHLMPPPQEKRQQGIN